MRSGTTAWVAALSCCDALDGERLACRCRLIGTPIFARHSARSVISGSRAALASTVVPLASAAAIIRFSVAPTDTFGKV